MALFSSKTSLEILGAGRTKTAYNSGFLLRWLTEVQSGFYRLSTLYPADRTQINFLIKIGLIIFNRLVLQADRTQNISTAESRLTLAASVN